MPKLTINGIEVETAAGATLLDAAKQAGIGVPTLCHDPGLPAQTSCMLCVVEETQSGRSLLACAAKAEEGMAVETNSPAIREARREVLELLLSEHGGDCEAPCRRMCPASMNIPVMLRKIAEGDMEAAARTAADELVIPATLGWVCKAPCQAGCRRAVHDETLAIRELHRQAAEAAIMRGAPPPECAIGSHKCVAVIGAGPSGLAAAYVLRRLGHACQVYEKAPGAGGRLRELPEEQLPHSVLEAEVEVIRKMGVTFRFDCAVGTDPSLAVLGEQYDAVVVACPDLAANETHFFATKQERMVVRSVAAGKKTARAAHEFLMQGETVPGREVYDSSLGRLDADRVAEFLVNRVGEEILSRPQQTEDARLEAERCFHCDCHAPLSCKLRQYATEYGARPRVFRAAERGPAAPLQRYGNVLFESGKCIKCGLCIQITREQGEPLGLAFVGRGFATEVKVPFNESLEAALQSCAKACVEVCPTGALVFADREERQL